jgi:hypothetical protein
MGHAGYWCRIGIWLLAALSSFGRAEAQAGSPELRHLRWPLLDIVTVPDSAELWFMAAPTPATTKWESGSNLVSLGIDPVLALQWVTVARKLVSDEARLAAGQPVHVTPPLRARRGPPFVVLATNPKKPSARTEFVLLVSDSAKDVNWKSFASAAQVSELLIALEATARDSREGTHAAWMTFADEDPDTPVSAVSQPRPAYPGGLALRNRVGRVWMSYVVTAGGRADPATFFPLLSDDSLFTEAAIQALLRSRYRPAVLHGQPVPQRVFQVILFRQR